MDASILREHYLAGITCDHEKKQDNPICSCSKVFLGWHPSIGAAVNAWIAHVEEIAITASSADRRMFDPLAVANQIVVDVAEIPDRNSPDDQPEMMLVTDAELKRIVYGRLMDALSGHTGIGSSTTRVSTAFVKDADLTAQRTVDTVARDAARYRWRHSNYKDAEGYEYGYCRVRWNPNGTVDSMLWASDEEIDAAMTADSIKEFALCQPCKTQIKCAAARKCDWPVAYGETSIASATRRVPSTEDINEHGIHVAEVLARRGDGKEKA